MKPSLFILSTNLSSFLSSTPGVLSAVSLCRFTKLVVALSDSAVELVKLKSILFVSFLLNPSLLLFFHFLLTFILISSFLLFIAISNSNGFKKFSNIPKYINGWVYIHNLFKHLGDNKYAIIQSVFSSIMQS